MPSDKYPRAGSCALVSAPEINIDEFGSLLAVQFVFSAKLCIRQAINGVNAFTDQSVYVIREVLQRGFKHLWTPRFEAWRAPTIYASGK